MHRLTQKMFELSCTGICTIDNIWWSAWLASSAGSHSCQIVASFCLFCRFSWSPPPSPDKFTSSLLWHKLPLHHPTSSSLTPHKHQHHKHFISVILQNTVKNCLLGLSTKSEQCVGLITTNFWQILRLFNYSVFWKTHGKSRNLDSFPPQDQQDRNALKVDNKTFFRRITSVIFSQELSAGHIAFLPAIDKEVVRESK